MQSAEGFKRTEAPEEERILHPNSFWTQLQFQFLTEFPACCPTLQTVVLPASTVMGVNSSGDTDLSFSMSILVALFLWRTPVQTGYFLTLCAYMWSNLD